MRHNSCVTCGGGAAEDRRRHRPPGWARRSPGLEAVTDVCEWDKWELYGDCRSDKTAVLDVHIF